jgi:hypothetical protein
MKWSPRERRRAISAACNQARSVGERATRQPATEKGHGASVKTGADRYVDRAHQNLMSAHALAILQSLILISAANGAPVLFARLLGARFAHPSDGGSCCATAILYSVVPRLGEASPQLFFLRPAPQSS